MADVTAEAQRGAIHAALRQTKGHRGEAAVALGMSRRTLTRRISELGMKDAIAAEAESLEWPAPTARATAARKSLT